MEKECKSTKLYPIFFKQMENCKKCVEIILIALVTLSHHYIRNGSMNSKV